MLAAEPELELVVELIRRRQTGRQQVEQLVEQVVQHRMDLLIVQEQELHKQQMDPMVLVGQPEELVDHPPMAYWPCVPSYLVVPVAERPYRS